MLVFVMLCTMILNPMAKAQEFPDLRPDHWCYNKIIDFEERGYVTGYDDGEFKPDRTITRAEYVTIVNNFFGYDANTENTAKFSDVSEDDWFESYVSEAVKRGYISGYPDGTFRPYEPIRRQEATVILSKILNIADEDYPVDHEDGLAQYADGEEVEDWAYKAVHSYSVYNFINGYEDNTIRLFRNVTRAETVQLLNTVEEKVIIDRDNKTNEVKDRPSGHKKRAATPVITVDETNDTNAWYNKVEARDDGKVTVKVTTTTTNATITVKVNGEVIPTTPFETEGTGVTFDLPEGKYEIVASATRSRYKTSYEAKSNADVDVTAPKVSGKVGDMGVSLSATDNLSGVDEIQYAWFIKDETGYKRVSNWAELKDYIELPAKAQNYYIGVKGSDIAGNKIDGGLKDNVIDDNIVTDGKTDEPYEIVNEAKVIDGKDEEQNPEDEPQAGESAITYHKNDGTNVEYVQKLTADATVLKGAIFSRDQYKLIGWAEIATGNKVYDLGETVNFTGDLYAVWQLNEPSDKPIVVEVKVSIKFVSGENGSLDGEANINVAYDTEWSTITVPTPKADTGYCFDKWTPELPTSESKVTADATYTANFAEDKNNNNIPDYKEDKYTITFVAGENGTLEGTTSFGDILTGTEWSTITVPTPKADTGYCFDKWTPELPTSESKVTADAVYTANFVKDASQTKKLSYTVEYYKDNEKVETVTEQVEVWVNDTEMLVDRAKINVTDKYTGYKFEKTEPTEIPTTIADGGVIKVYYVTNTYKVSYDANGGENAPAEQTKIHDVELKLSNSKPTREGYTFIEWNTKEDGTGESYTLGATYTENSSLMLYAQWEEISELEAEISCEYPTSNGVKAEPGDKVAYEITLSSATSNVTLPTEVKVKLDSKVKLDIDSLPANAIYDSETNTIIWTVSDVNDKLSYEVEIDTDIPAGSKVTTKITEGATATNNVIDIESTVTVKQEKDKNIILVLDVSRSMDYCVKHNDTFRTAILTGQRGHGFGLFFEECNEKTRLKALKDAANNFVTDVCNGRGNEDVTVTVIAFDNNATNKGTIKNPTIEQLTTIINKLSAYGGTNMRGAVKAATTVLNSDSMLTDAVNYVIVLSDGKPDDSQYYCDNATLNAFRATNANAYAIGIGDNYSRSELLKIVNNDSSKLFDANQEDDLEAAFNEIGSILNKTQTTEGIIEIDITDIAVYPIKLAYRDTAIRTVTVNNESELNANNLSMNGNKLIWDISKYPSCSEFEMEVNKEPVISTMSSMELMDLSMINCIDEVLEYGDSELNDNIEELENEINEEPKVTEDVENEKDKGSVVADKELGDNENQNDSAQKQLVSEGANLAGDSALDIPTLDQEPEAKNGEDESTSNDQSQNVEDKNNETKINETIPSTPTDDSSSDTTPTSVQENEDETKNENTLNESTDDSIQATEIKEKEAEDETKVEELKDVVSEQVVEEPTGVEEEIDEPKTAEPEQKDDSEKENEEKTGAELEEEPVGTTDSTQPTENGEKQLDEEQTTTEQPIVSEN